MGNEKNFAEHTLYARGSAKVDGWNLEEYCKMPIDYCSPGERTIVPIKWLVQLSILKRNDFWPPKKYSFDTKQTCSWYIKDIV